MGCDIHTLIEKRQPDGSWKIVDVPLKTWRSYDTFAILANVRNGYGFAGCDTGDGFVPISDPKGLPEDTAYTEDWAYGDDGHWLGDHSFSWLTLRELKEYDYDQATVKRGVISEEYYKQLKAEGKDRPESWSGGVGGWSQKTVTPEVMDEIISGKRPREIADPLDSCLLPSIAVKTEAKPFSYNVQMSWPIKYRDVAGMILDHIIPALESVADGDPDSVRLVFGFDS